MGAKRMTVAHAKSTTTICVAYMAKPVVVEEERRNKTKEYVCEREREFERGRKRRLSKQENNDHDDDDDGNGVRYVPAEQNAKTATEYTIRLPNPKIG